MGIQEPAPRPRPGGSGCAPGGWVVLLLLAVGLGVWLGRRAEPEAPPSRKSPPIVEPERVVDNASAEQIVHLREMLQQAERRMLDQQQEIDNLEQKLERAEAEAERNRQGLEQAVAELQRIQEGLDQIEAAALARESRALPSVPTPRVGPLGAPHVTVHQSGYVVASGRVHNPTDYPARGTLEVSLVGSGGVIDTRGFPMTLAAGATERYDITFTNVFPTERLGAQARWIQ